MPAGETSTFKVIETELAFEILVGALGSPPMLDMPNELKPRSVFGGCDEVELVRLFLAIFPLHEKPYGFAFGSRNAFVRNGKNTPRSELCGEYFLRPFSPSGSTKAIAFTDLVGVLRDRQCLSSATSVEGIESPHLGRGPDGNTVQQAFFANISPKLGGISVGRIDQNHAAWNAFLKRPSNHLDRELRLRLELDVVGNSSLFTSDWVIGPLLRKVQLEIDGQVVTLRRDSEANTNLAVRDLSGGTGVLSFDSNGVLALFQEPSVIDDPVRNRLSLRHRCESVPRGFFPSFVITPLRVRDEMLNSLMLGIYLVRIWACPRRNRLHTLSCAISK